MKKLITVSLLAAAGMMTAGFAQADEALAKAKNCMSCHQVDKKVVGPAFKDIAAKYKGQPDAVARLMDKVRKGVAAWQLELPDNRLVRHLSHCALTYGCPAAINRWS